MKKGQLVKRNDKTYVLLEIKGHEFICLDSYRNVVSLKNVKESKEIIDNYKEAISCAVLDLYYESELESIPEGENILNFVKKNKFKKEEILDVFQENNELYIITKENQLKIAS